jgi:hypothetical protein
MIQWRGAPACAGRGLALSGRETRLLAPPTYSVYRENVADMTVEDIKVAIAALPEQDKLSLAAWLNLQTMDDWDRQMQKDFSPGGRGAKFLEQVQREIDESSSQPIEQGFAKRRRRRA